MSLNISLCLKQNFLCNHKIKNLLMLLEKKSLVTCAQNGDLIIWKIEEDWKTLIPKVFLTPSLSRKIGKVIYIDLLIKPLQYYTVVLLSIINIKDGILNCLITLHEDNRIRMWNLEDGRCFNISSTDMFTNI